MNDATAISEVFGGILAHVRYSLAEHGHTGLLDDKIGVLRSFVDENGEKLKRVATKARGKEFNAVLICIFAVSSLSRCFKHNTKELVPIKANWGGSPNSAADNAPSVLWLLLIQFTNHLLGIVRLCESGLAASAMVVTRTILELGRNIMAITINEELMRIFLASNANKESLKRWQQQAQPNNVIGLILEFLTGMGMDRKLSESVKSKLKDSHKYLCGVVHSDFDSAITTGFSSASKEDQLIRSALFGAHTDLTRAVLSECITFTNTMLNTLMIAFNKIHGFSPDIGDHHWKDTVSLQVAINAIWLADFSKPPSVQDALRYLQSEK